jgi:hypothetical protein
MISPFGVELVLDLQAKSAIYLQGGAPVADRKHPRIHMKDLLGSNSLRLFCLAIPR